MKSSLLAIRSIGADYANRLYIPVLFLFIVISVVLLGLIFWLASTNGWWFVLAIPLIIAVCVGSALLVVIKLVIRSVTPKRSVEQRKISRQIAAKIMNLSETATTPKYLLLLRVVRDIAAPRESGFIGELSNDTASLKNDFVALRRLFEP